MTEALMVNYAGTLGLISLDNNFFLPAGEILDSIMAAIVFASLWVIPLNAEPQPCKHEQTSGERQVSTRQAVKYRCGSELIDWVEPVVLGGSGLRGHVLMFSMWCWCSITGFSALSQMLHVVSTHAAVVYPTTDTMLLVCFHYDHNQWVQVHLWFCLCCWFLL